MKQSTIIQNIVLDTAPTLIKPILSNLRANQAGVTLSFQIKVKTRNFNLSQALNCTNHIKRRTLVSQDSSLLNRPARNSAMRSVRQQCGQEGRNAVRKAAMRSGRLQCGQEGCNAVSKAAMRSGRPQCGVATGRLAGVLL